MIFLGVCSSNAAYDTSIIVCCLRTFVETGKTRKWRTKDWRRPPGPPRFPLVELSKQLQAMKYGKNVCELSDEDYATAVSELGAGKVSTVRWMTSFASDSNFGNADESIDAEIDDIHLIGDEDAEADDSEVQYDEDAIDIGEEASEPGVELDQVAEDSLGDGKSEPELSSSEQDALRQCIVLKADLDKFSSYGGGKDELNGKTTCARKESPRPFHIEATLWAHAGKKWR